ncbi:MAG: MBL fold metallo-hydrolase [Alphaproteobacteria bacterium]|nr:MBL fold metallo-hydrolase [Alphaproteobacteria bacterium]
MRIKFWGVRGSVSCAYPDFLEYGGNTACVEVDVMGRTVVFDAGTGLPWLGNDLLKRGVKDVQLLMSHFHNDHTGGFNYFKHIYIPGCSVTVHAALNYGELTIDDLIRRHMSEELHPVQYEHLASDLTSHGFVAGDAFDLFDGARVKTGMLTHPAGATAYRLEAEGKVFVYATDTEHTPGRPDLALVELMRDADLVVYDTCYTEEELPTKQGWGHSTWNEAVKLCRMANAKRLALFHYSPDYDDTMLRALEAEAHAEWSGAFGAKEGMEVNI